MINDLRCSFRTGSVGFSDSGRRWKGAIQNQENHHAILGQLELTTLEKLFALLSGFTIPEVRRAVKFVFRLYESDLVNSRSPESTIAVQRAMGSRR
jgi:hypothetical protein